MAPKLLGPQEIQKELATLTGWTLSGNQIAKQITLDDFVRAVGYVTSVALLAQTHDHHPDIDIRWNKVTLVLSTHSAGGLTAKDFELAREIDAL
jgi:4a-hydroxytetrahydrobiopterin dehydratase